MLYYKCNSLKCNKLSINIYINSFYAKSYIPSQYAISTFIALISESPSHVETAVFRNPSRKNVCLSYSLVGMKFAQLLSCRVLTLACLVDQMDRLSRENFFQAPVEHCCRSTVVSIYHSNLVCFRQPSKTPIVVRRLPPLEFVRRIQPLDCFRNRLNRLSLTKTHAVSSKRSLCSPQYTASNR